MASFFPFTAVYRTFLQVAFILPLMYGNSQRYLPAPSGESFTNVYGIGSPQQEVAGYVEVNIPPDPGRRARVARLAAPGGQGDRLAPGSNDAQAPTHSVQRPKIRVTISN